MGVPLVGKGHKRQTGSQEGANRGRRCLFHRIGRSGSSGCSSPNHQQSRHSSTTLSETDRCSIVGTLLPRRTASKRTFNAGFLLGLCQKLDPPEVGRLSTQDGEDGGSRTLASRHEFGRGKQGENQVRDVRIVFSWGPLGALQLQPNLFGRGCRQRRKTGSKHWSTRQWETSQLSACAESGAGEVRAQQIEIPRAASRISGRSARNATWRAWCFAVDGLRFRVVLVSNPELFLLETRRTFEVHQNRGLSPASAYAPNAQIRSPRVEVSKPLHQARGLRIPLTAICGSEAFGSCSDPQTPYPTCVREARNCWRRLAHVSPHCGDDAGRNGRTPTHHPRLLAAQQSARDKQVPAGHLEEQTPCPRETGGRNSAHRDPFELKIQLDPIGHEKTARECRSCNLIGPKWTQIVFGVLWK